MRLESWTSLPRSQVQDYRHYYWTDEDPFRNAGSTLLARGNGQSYGDVCLPCQQAVVCTPLDRILAFDRTSGRVRVESGIKLSELLAVTVPAGWTLPVIPGSGAVTVGGAIANDVHGKNHHWAGTFGCWIERIELVRSDGRYLCTPEEHPELFRATIGGLGLTGIITWAELQLVRCSSAWLTVERFPFATLDEFFCLSEQVEEHGNYVVGWCDVSTPGKYRGIVSVARFCDDGDFSTPPRHVPLSLPPMPVSVFTRTTVQLTSALYYSTMRRRVRQRMHYTDVFFPLGRLPWNRLFGRRGFFQLHAVVPRALEREATHAICSRLWRAKVPLPLCVLKRFGARPSPGLLSFPIEGTSIAVDLPNHSRSVQALDEIITMVASIGGRIYPAKDARMASDHFQQMFPQWHQVERLRDPRCCSQFWRRVTSS
ncbi:MAG: FAD-binding oxidoreductase [Chlorobi bacterium]|nr:FAD-binding oxidoreductase [Chlorobiota bacterium]